jgi:hypothetical protein
MPVLNDGAPRDRRPSIFFSTAAQRNGSSTSGERAS